MPAAPNRQMLTPLFLQKKLKPRDVPYLIWDEKQKGLAVRVETTGHTSYKAIYRFGGRPRWYHIAAVGAIGLARAREIAGDVMYAVAKGSDPAAQRRAERTAGTFDDLADQHATFAEGRNKSWKQADALVRRHLRPKWGKLPAASVSRSDVRAMITRIKAPIVANQVLASASAIFSFAIKQEIGGITANPCSGVERNPTQSRERVLSDSEIPKFWEAFGEIGVRGAALRMLLITGQRPGEVAHMHLDHIIDGFWNLPGDPVPELRWPGTKNGASHSVCLSAPAREIILAMEPADFVFAGAYGAPVFGLAAAMAEICEKLEVERATPHDLRRTNGSAITRLGFGRDAMNRIQNHKDGGIATVYDRHAYIEENRRIMDAVAAHFMALVGEPPLRGNVVNLR
jgi:integrase